MTTRKTLANAIRFLSMDAVQKPNQGTLVHLWAWLILQKYYGVIF